MKRGMKLEFSGRCAWLWRPVSGINTVNLLPFCEGTEQESKYVIRLDGVYNRRELVNHLKTLGDVE
jgi:hypothetical protein